jgi:hypothetical protein
MKSATKSVALERASSSGIGFTPTNLYLFQYHVWKIYISNYTIVSHIEKQAIIFYFLEFLSLAILYISLSLHTLLRKH